MSAAPLWNDFEGAEHARNGRITLNLYDDLSAFVPRRPGTYLRISSDRFGLEAGVVRQHEDAEDTRTRLGRGPCRCGPRRMLFDLDGPAWGRLM